MVSQEDREAMVEDMKLEHKLKKDLEFFVDYYEDLIKETAEKVQELERLLKFFEHDVDIREII